MSKPIVLLIDGHSLAFRAYYAFTSNPLRNSQGIPTSICYGFLSGLLGLIESYHPQYLAIAFDTAEPTFRHLADQQYKVDRKETPDDFIPDIQNLQLLLNRLEIPVITCPGYEADDILGTLATLAGNQGFGVKIVSGDRDLFQLVEDEKEISVLYFDKNAVKNTKVIVEYHSVEVEEKLGIKPAQVIDYKALCGDKSDNIPGVTGIGEKTAVKLLKKYGTLTEVYQHLEELKPAEKKKLLTGKDNALHSQMMATIVTDVSLTHSLEDCHFKSLNADSAIPILQELDLNKIIKQLKKLQPTVSSEIIAENTPSNQQLSLFPSVTVEDNTILSQPLVMISETSQEKKIHPLIIDTPEKLENLITILKNCLNSEHPVAWDTETSSLEVQDTKLVGIGCCWGDNKNNIAYIPVNHTTGEQLEQSLVLSSLKPILESDKYPKVLQNSKFDRQIFYHQGINLQGIVFDTLLASYVINPRLTHNLTDLSKRYLTDIVSLSYKDLGIPKGKTIADLEIETVANYCGLDAYATYLLVDKLKNQLKQTPDLYRLLMEVEIPLEPVLSKMEILGITLDIPYLETLSKSLQEELKDIQNKVYEIAGEVFNLDSPKQLSELLFEKLGLNRKKSRKIKTGYSTDHATLEKLQGEHPVIDYILDHRTLSKLQSTYTDALVKLVHPKTGRIHTDFNQTVTETGRLSSSNPNLQNIPIRTEFSKKIRQAFIPQKDWLLVSADYSQIELRILAHFSQEPALIDAYNNNLDVHTVTAKLLLEKEDISPEERRLGKIINFGVIYGMGSQRFSREAGVSVEVGKEFIQRYRKTYSNVFNYLERMKKEAISQGYVTTLLGRRRYFEFVSDCLKPLQGVNPEEINLEALKLDYYDTELLRASANAPIQGSSADIIKVAMIQLDRILEGYQAKLLLQVHDELVLEIPPNEWEELQTKIKITMENAVSLSIPLLVEVHHGYNWMTAK